MTPAIRGPQAVTAQLPSISAATIEKVLMQGDLGQLKADERVAYYKSLCDSLGLNPLTRPFEYLQLNGKLQLYAKKECTEQLRHIYNVSVQIVSREVIEGCFVVTARASMPTGRQDESLGSVGIENLKGENRSNAMMKAETKAKRRVTLSICGLAFLDDAEVESVRSAYHVPVDDQTGAIPDPAPAATLHEDIVANPPKETKAERKSDTPFNWLSHFAELKARYKKLKQEPEYYRILGTHGVKKSNEFPATIEGKERAKAAYKELSLHVQELEVLMKQASEVFAPEVDKLPDPVEQIVGHRVTCKGKTWEVADNGESHYWKEV